MKPMKTALIVAMIVAAFAVTAEAQEMGWDTDEEVQRVEQEQWDEAEQGRGPVTTDGPEIVRPDTTTKGEKTRQKWEEIPTGYGHRIFVIQQDNLAGKWDKANVLPAKGFESGWKPISQGQYQQAIKSGILDGKLKSTDYAPFYASMSRVCSVSKFKQSDLHIKAAESGKWRVSQRKTTPLTEYRELSFECLAKAK